jgi:hypothetical protein
LDGLLLLVPLQSVAFWGLLVASTAAYNIKVLVSGYQSIDIYGIVLFVKFDVGLSISVLRNKQLVEKKGGQKLTFSKKFKFFNFATPPFEENADLGKSLTFLDCIFLETG